MDDAGDSLTSTPRYVLDNKKPGHPDGLFDYEGCPIYNHVVFDHFRTCRAGKNEIDCEI